MKTKMVSITINILQLAELWFHLKDQYNPVCYTRHPIIFFAISIFHGVSWQLLQLKNSLWSSKKYYATPKKGNKHSQASVLPTSWLCSPSRVFPPFLMPQVLFTPISLDLLLHWYALLQYDQVLKMNIQAYLVLLHLSFIALCKYINWRFVATLYWASLLAPFFQQHLLTLCLCTILVILTNFILFQYFYICDPWCYYKKITTHARLRWWLTCFSSKVHLLLRYSWFTVLHKF